MVVVTFFTSRFQLFILAYLASKRNIPAVYVQKMRKIESYRKANPLNSFDGIPFGGVFFVFMVKILITLNEMFDSTKRKKK